MRVQRMCAPKVSRLQYRTCVEKLTTILKWWLRCWTMSNHGKHCLRAELVVFSADPSGHSDSENHNQWVRRFRCDSCHNQKSCLFRECWTLCRGCNHGCARNNLSLHVDDIHGYQNLRQGSYPHFECGPERISSWNTSQYKLKSFILQLNAVRHL